MHCIVVHVSNPLGEAHLDSEYHDVLDAQAIDFTDLDNDNLQVQQEVIHVLGPYLRFNRVSLPFKVLAIHLSFPRIDAEVIHKLFHFRSVR